MRENLEDSGTIDSIVGFLYVEKEEMEGTRTIIIIVESVKEGCDGGAHVAMGDEGKLVGVKGVGNRKEGKFDGRGDKTHVGVRDTERTDVREFTREEFLGKTE